MSRKSRKDRASAFSLFSFQDAITSAVGVIVLVTLMLAVRMTQSAAETARKYENAIVAQELEAKKSELERRLERAKLPDSTDEFLDEAIKLDPTEIAARLRAAKRKLTAAEREKARLEEERAELDELVGVPGGEDEAHVVPG